MDPLRPIQAINMLVAVYALDPSAKPNGVFRDVGYGEKLSIQMDCIYLLEQEGYIKPFPPKKDGGQSWYWTHKGIIRAQMGNL